MKGKRKEKSDSGVRDVRALLSFSLLPRYRLKYMTTGPKRKKKTQHSTRKKNHHTFQRATHTKKKKSRGAHHHPLTLYLHSTLPRGGRETRRGGTLKKKGEEKTAKDSGESAHVSHSILHCHKEKTRMIVFPCLLEAEKDTLFCTSEGEGQKQQQPTRASEEEKRSRADTSGFVTSLSYSSLVFSLLQLLLARSSAQLRTGARLLDQWQKLRLLILAKCPHGGVGAEFW
jgi:hypothetical protein